MKNKFLLSILTGLMLALAWPLRGIPVLAFFGLIPLLFVEQQIANSNKRRKGLRVFGYSYLAFAIWNIGTIWWLYNSLNPDGSHSLVAVAVPVFLDSLLTSLVVLFYHLFKRKMGLIRGMLMFATLWICYEKLHTTWQLSFPWLTLGNAFAGWHQWIQWYDITGVFGGSAWILTTNLVGFWGLNLYLATKDRKILLKYAGILVLIIGIPLAISLIKYYTVPLNSKENVTAVLLQPDMDPYDQKFQTDSIKTTQDLIGLAQAHSKGKVDFYMAPETAIPGQGSLSETGFQNSTVIQMLRDFTKVHPGSTFITGAATYRVYLNPNEKTKTAYYIPAQNLWVDNFNAALEINPSGKIQTYHKGKLVPGVESFPYMNLLKPLLGNAMLDMGGTFGSLGSDSIRKVFVNPFNNAKVAPIICYESAYGHYVTRYVKNGANLLAILTNDSWWGRSPGHRQLLAWAKLRAIETRKDVVRAANSGTSAHINRRGDIVKELSYGKKGAIEVKAGIFTGETFYVKHGDYIYNIALYAFLILFVTYLTKLFRTRKIKN